MGTTTNLVTTCPIDLAALMRKHRVTIRELSRRTGITQKRIREVRALARLPYLHYCDFVQAVTGVDVFSKARWDAICRQRDRATTEAKEAR